MNKKKDNLYMENCCVMEKTVRRKITYYKTDYNNQSLFLDGDENGSEDPVPYKTRFNRDKKSNVDE